MIPSDELYANASAERCSKRITVTNPQDLTADSLFVTQNTPSTRELFKPGYEKKILKDWLEFDKIMKPDECEHDKELMMLFLEKNTEGRLPIMTDTDLSNYLPTGSALIYSLRADLVENKASWQFPSFNMLEDIRKRSSMDLLSLESLDVREVTLTKSSTAEVESAIDWTMKNIKEDFKNFPIDAVSVHIDTVTLPESLYTKVAQAAKAKLRNDSKETCVRASENDGGLPIKIPTRIVIGNGMTWMSCFRFFTEEANTDATEFDICLKPLPEKFLSFIQTLPTWVGVNITEMKMILNRYFSELHCIDVLLPNCIELESLAALLGWKLTNTDAFTLNLITMGSLLNSEVAKADNHWALKWDDLHCSYQSYCVGVTKFIYGVFVVLFSMILRNLFPDPDVVCAALELRQTEAINWLSTMILECLKETKLNKREFMFSKTRVDLVKCLRKVTYMNDFTIVADKIPAVSVDTLAELIPDWPNIPSGGARFIQTVRAKFMYQYKALQALNFEHMQMQPNIGRPINPDFIKDVTFNRGILVCDDGSKATKDGLTNLPQFNKKIFNLDETDLSFKELADQAMKTGQSIILGIVEWGTHNPDKISPLLIKLNDIDMDTIPPPFWIQKTYVYERLRQMHMHLYNEHAPVVHAIAKELYKKHDRVRDQELKTKRKEMEHLKNRIARENLYDAHKQMSISGSKISTGAQQRAYEQIPGHNQIRNRKAKAAKKRKMQQIKNLANYIPNNEWAAMGKRNCRPFNSCKQAKDHCEEQEVISETCDNRYSDRPPTPETRYDDEAPGPSSQLSPDVTRLQFEVQRSEHARIAAMCTDVHSEDDTD